MREICGGSAQGERIPGSFCAPIQVEQFMYNPAETRKMRSRDTHEQHHT